MENINYSDKYAVMAAVQDIAYNNEGQADLSARLSELRQAAYAAGEHEAFDEGFVIARNSINSDRDFQRTGLALMYDYTLDDFLSSKEPYYDIFEQPDGFEQKQMLERMSIMAKNVGLKNFKGMYKSFLEGLKQVNQSTVYSVNPTCFPDQPMELEAGQWLCDEHGVKKSGALFEEIVCLHPIMPIERLVNIDTNEEKLKVAYCKGCRWKTLIAGKNDLFDRSKVIKLANYGVSVTSDTATGLSKYLCEIEALNYERIPEVESVARLGYISDGHFSPYVGGLVFDGESNYSAAYKAISEHKGNFEEWRETALKCRTESLTAQILLAASFASPLISKIGGLVFFVHLWSVTSGTGKTVALMLAASVWGNPDIGGEYLQSFNATQVGHERMAAFLNNIPMCIDELQLSKDSHGRSKFDVYQLGQGRGRTRGTKAGGIDRTPTWSLAILTTGESPMSKESDGGGALNRVIDVECGADEIVIKDGMGTSRAIKQNYGHAGEKFIDALTDDVVEEARKLYDRYFKELSSGETTEKQAMAAAMILVGDELADRFIFKSGKHLTVEEISRFLKSKTAVSAGERGYNYICDWVTMNANKFKKDNENSEIYGAIDGGCAYIIYSVFDKAMRDAGFDTKAILAWLKSKCLIDAPKQGNTRTKRLRPDLQPKCVWLRLPQDNNEPYDFDVNDFEELV